MSCEKPVFFPPSDGQETWTWHAVSLIISWTLFSQSYYFFCFFSFIYVLLKCVCVWTTHLDVRTVSNLLQSLTTSFPLRLLFSVFYISSSVVTGSALNLHMFPHNFAHHQNALISISLWIAKWIFFLFAYLSNVLDCHQPSPYKY